MRHEVERANSTRLAALQTLPVSYDARDSGSAAPDRRKAVLAGMMVPERLVLKKGAQVMLVKNVDDQRGLVNGAVGRVLGFFAAPRGKSEGVVRNVKLSEDGKSVVFSGEGKENVKLTSAAGASTKTTTTTKIEGEKPKSAPDAELFPLVEFPTPMGRETALVTRDEFRVEDNEGNVLARRVQASMSFSRLCWSWWWLFCLTNIAPPGSSHPCVGPVHPQEPGSDHTARQGRSRACVREGPELCCSVSRCDD
jgi:ATP-dependent DNA helicase PIF1